MPYSEEQKAVENAMSQVVSGAEGRHAPGRGLTGGLGRERQVCRIVGLVTWSELPADGVGAARLVCSCSVSHARCVEPMRCGRDDSGSEWVSKGQGMLRLCVGGSDCEGGLDRASAHRQAAHCRWRRGSLAGVELPNYSRRVQEESKLQ